MLRRATRPLLALCSLAVVTCGSCEAQLLGEAIDLGRQKRTLADMRTLATAILNYGIDHESLPASAPATALRGLLEPEYLRATPTEDGWSHELRYVSWKEGALSAGPDRFFVLSSGNDGQWEIDDPSGYTSGATGGFSNDLVFAGNLTSMDYPETRFIRAPAWALENERQFKARSDALVSAASLDSVALLRHEIDRAAREARSVLPLLDRRTDIELEVGKLRASVNAFDSIVPTTAGLDTYLRWLASVAEHSRVTLQSFEPRTVQHDGYLEIVVEVELQGDAENVESFRDRLRRGARLASLDDTTVAGPATRFAISLFAVPPIESVEPRRCRPIEDAALPVNDPEVDELKNRLRSLCDQLDELHEFRELLGEYRRLMDRTKLVVSLARVYHPEQ